ncbi:MAG TPA: hypothetical protein VGO47_02335, partial [Chlamydiales bacterium]|nr:hypothetical protein [Chlamydiales bacterium]
QIILQKYQTHFDPANGRGRCMPHSTNLAAQIFMKMIDEGPDPDDEDQYIYVKHLQINHDPTEDDLLKEYENEVDMLDLDETPSTDTYFLNDKLEQELGITSEELSAPLKKVCSCRINHISIHSPLGSMAQLRVICTKIASSPQRRAAFRHLTDKLCEEDCKHLMVVRDVSTRWNSTHAMIVRARKLRKVR